MKTSHKFKRVEKVVLKVQILPFIIPLQQQQKIKSLYQFLPYKESNEKMHLQWNQGWVQAIQNQKIHF